MREFPWNRIVTVDDVDESLVSSFTCGNEAMDNWFLNKALSWCYLGFCQVYIALDEEGIVGFFSLSPTQLEPRSLSGSMRKGKNSMSHPGLLLGRIAVRKGLQGTEAHVGSLLLEHAIYRAVAISQTVGGRFIVLDAKNEELCEWYSRHGFRSLRDSELRMIMPMKDARAMTRGLGEEHFLF